MFGLSVFPRVRFVGRRRRKATEPPDVTVGMYSWLPVRFHRHIYQLSALAVLYYMAVAGGSVAFFGGGNPHTKRRRRHGSTIRGVAG